jgi:glucoamylase
MSDVAVHHNHCDTPLSFLPGNLIPALIYGPNIRASHTGEYALPQAPGHPGIPPRWTSSDKTGVGTALSPLSRVWFTMSHGILNEIYYPRCDQACIRDFGLMVTDGHSFFAEEKRDCSFEVFTQEDGVPAYTLRNTHNGGRFRIHKRIITDPRRDVVLQQIRLEDLSRAGDLRLFAMLAPHLINGGNNNTGWLGDYKGQGMLFAEGHSTSLAMAASTPFRARSVGYVGASDGFRELARTYQMGPIYDYAPDGNVGLLAEIGLRGDEPVTIALGFGRGWAEAAFRVRSSLLDDFEDLHRDYSAGWKMWQSTLRPLDSAVGTRNSYRVSTAAIRTHESPSFPGGLIASLSVPWGASKGDDDLGGYHLVWPRDLVQTAGALLACGATEEAKRVLDYLRATQEPQGNWAQNTWLDGTPYWTGQQMDETAFPILLTDLAWRNGTLTKAELGSYWPMVREAAGFLVRHGPRTGQGSRGRRLLYADLPHGRGRSGGRRPYR